MVPHLTTALTGPLLELERRFLAASPQIEHWLRGQWQEHTPPFYSSCDLRNSGFKLAPVDTNLFPGGFNNLNPAFLPLCVQAAMTAIDKICPMAKSLLLIPEKHTRNSFYLTNVARLVQIFTQAGLNVRLGTLDPEITAPTELALPGGDVAAREPWRLAAAGLRVAHLPQQSVLDRQFPIRVGDVVALGAWSRIGLWKALGGGLRREVDEALATVGLLGCAQRPISDLSVGQFQRVLFARILTQDARLILLDEPFAGVDPISVIDIKRIIEHLRDSGLGVLITDHNVRETLAVCERAYIVSQGHLIAHGTPQQILEDEQVKRVYLGEDFRL